MGLFGAARQQQVIVKSYGRGSLLGLLSLPLALLMASQGMGGWRESAIREMEDDAAAMARKGYRVRDSGEFGLPLFGITYFRVTYELVDATARRAP